MTTTAPPQPFPIRVPHRDEHSRWRARLRRWEAELSLVELQAEGDAAEHRLAMATVADELRRRGKELERSVDAMKGKCGASRSEHVKALERVWKRLMDDYEAEMRRLLVH